MNTLYGENEYKSALSHLNYIKSKVDRISKDHTKLIKFGDSAYRCKTLKRVALGKMAKLIMKSVTKASLQYLEECRQHLSRLPTIDTSTRTVILCGFPNVGKSSFLNKISRADVDVQPYAFTTKSLFVGHCDYQNLRWQFIDTPGLLDRPVAECNTSEMLAITALDALDEAGILFLIDLSEQCGYTIKQQVALLGNIRALFGNKPLVVGLNKTDSKKLEELEEEDRKLIEAIKSTDSQEVKMSSMSTMTDDGVMDVRNTACDLVLTARVSHKLDKPSIHEMKNRLYIANKIVKTTETNTIPTEVLARLEQQALMESANPGCTRKKTLFDAQKAAGNEFVYDTREEWLIANREQRFDIIPEIYNGHNIADFGYIDEAALEKFRQEEKLLDDIGFYEIAHEPLPEATRKLAERIREAEDLKKLDNIEKTNTTGRKTINRANKHISLKSVQEGMSKLGVKIASDAVSGLSLSVCMTYLSLSITAWPRQVAITLHGTVCQSQEGRDGTTAVGVDQQVSPVSITLTIWYQGRQDRRQGAQDVQGQPEEEQSVR